MCLGWGLDRGGIGVERVMWEGGGPGAEGCGRGWERCRLSKKKAYINMNVRLL